MNSKIKVKAPSSTANLGSSFDCLGLALDLYCYITLEKNDKHEIVVLGQNSDEISKTKDNLVYKVIEYFCSFKKIEMPKLKITIENQGPLERGLGSSAAAIAGALFAVNNFLNNGKLSINELLNIALDFEKHPDNLAASFFGGLVMSSVSDSRVYYYKFNEFQNVVSNKAIVVLIPEYNVSTGKSRKDLLNSIAIRSHKDYVLGLNKSVANIIALVNGDFKALKETMNDTIWHQKQRIKDIPYMQGIFESALKEGAYGVWLSGSGPSIITFCESKDAEKIGVKMKSALENSGEKGSFKILKPDFKGTRLAS